MALGKYEIEISNVQGPWPEDEYDFTTLGQHTITLVESIDEFTLGLNAPLEINELNTSMLYNLVLSQPCTTDLTITLVDHEGVQTTEMITAGEISLEITKSLIPNVDYIKSETSKISLEILDVQLSNDKEFELLTLNPKRAFTDIIDNVDNTLINLKFVNESNLPVTESIVGSSVNLIASITQNSEYSFRVRLSDGTIFNIPANNKDIDVNVGPVSVGDIPGNVEITILEIVPFNTIGETTLEMIDLENVTIGLNATIVAGYPDSCKIKVSGPIEILEGVGFNLLVETEYLVFDGDIVLGDNKGNSIIIVEGTTSTLVPFLIAEDYYVNDDFNFAITSVSNNAGFGSVNISGIDGNYPIGVQIPVIDNPTNVINVTLEYANDMRDYYVERQSEFNGSLSNDNIPVILKLSTVINGSQVTVQAKEDFTFVLTDGANDLDFIFESGLEEKSFLVPATFAAGVPYDSYDINLSNVSIKSANVSQFEDSNIDNIPLAFNIRRFRQVFVKLEAQESEYLEGDTFANIDIILDKAPLLADVVVVINNANLDEHIIPKDSTLFTIQLPISPDSPYIDMQTLTYNGIKDIEYFGNPTPADTLSEDKEYQAAYVSQDGVAIRIIDTIDDTHMTISTTTNTVEGLTPLTINYNFDNIPDPLAIGGLEIVVKLMDGSTILKEESLNLTIEQIGSFIFDLPNVSTAKDYNIVVEYVSGGNYENVILTQADSISMIPKPNRNAVVTLEIGELEEKQNPFDITAIIKNTDGDYLKPRFSTLDVNVHVEYIGQSLSYDKVIQVQSADQYDIGGDYKGSINFTDEDASNDIYLNTAPTMSIYISSIAGNYFTEDYGFDSIVFVDNAGNPINIIPTDTIDDTNISITSVTNSGGSSIIDEHGSLGSKVSVTVELSNSVATGTVLEFSLTAQNPDNTFTDYGVHTISGSATTIEVTPLFIGEFTPNISGIDLIKTGNFENVIIVDNTDSVIIRTSPIINILPFITPEDVSSLNSNISEKDGIYKINTIIDSFRFEPFMGQGAITIPESEYDAKARDIIKSEVLVNCNLSSNDPSFDQDIMFVISSDSLGNDLKETTEYVLDGTFDDIYLNSNKTITLTPSTINTQLPFVDLRLSTTTSTLTIIDGTEAEKDSTLIEINAAPGQSLVMTEKGGTFTIEVSISEAPLEDINITLNLQDFAGNGIVDESGSVVSTVLTIPTGTSGSITKTINIPSLDDIYLGNDLGSINLIPDLSNIVTEFEKLEVSTEPITISLIDGTSTDLIFSLYVEKDSNGNPIDHNPIMFSSDGTGTGDHTHTQEKFNLVFNNFFFMKDNNPVFPDFRDTDEFSFTLVESTGRNGLFTRKRRITIKGSDMVMANTLTGKYPHLFNAGNAYELKDNMFFTNYPSSDPVSTIGSGVTTSEEMINRFNIDNDSGGYSNYSNNSNNLSFMPLSNVRSDELDGIWRAGSNKTIVTAYGAGFMRDYTFDIIDIDFGTFESISFASTFGNTFEIRSDIVGVINNAW